MLHDVDFLWEKVSGHASAEDVWSGDTCFGVEELEPENGSNKVSNDDAMELRFLTIHLEWSPCELCRVVQRELVGRKVNLTMFLWRWPTQRVAELKVVKNAIDIDEKMKNPTACIQAMHDFAEFEKFQKNSKIVK